MDFELKTHIEEQQKAFLEFKAENDKGRKANEEKLRRIEAAMDGAAVAIRQRPEFARRSDDESKAFFGHLRRAEQQPALERKALVASDDTAGGYLAPSEYVKELIRAIVLFSPVRQFVKVRPTSSRSVQEPKRTGTSAAGWVAESATRSESQNPTYGLLDIPTHEMTAEVYCSYAQLEDSAFDMEAELGREFAEQFAVTEGAAVVAGNGVGKPLGFLTSSPALTNVASGSAAGIGDANGQADGIISLFFSVKSAYAGRGAWLLNRQTLGALRRLKDSHNQYIWAPSLPDSYSGVVSFPALLHRPFVRLFHRADVTTSRFARCGGRS